MGEKGERGVVVTEGEKKIKGGRRGEVRGEAMERGMDWEGKGRESGGGRWVGNEWKNMESADSSQFPWQRQAFPTHSFPLVSFSLSLCLIHSLTSFTLQFLFRFFFSSPFFSVSVRLCNHVTASSPPSARSSPPFFIPLNSLITSPRLSSFLSSFFSFPFLPFLSLTPNPLLTPFLVPSLVLVQFPIPLSPLTFAFMLRS